MSRPFERHDDEGIVALYARLHAADASIDALDLGRWRAFCDLSIFDGGRRFRVIDGDEGIVALMTVGSFREAKVEGDIWRVRILVDPRARRRGLATALFRACEADARHAGVSFLQAFVTGDAARAFAASVGMATFVHDLFLVRPPRPFDAPVPAGVTIRAYRGAEDHDAWAALVNATLVRDKVFTPDTATSVAGYARTPGFALWLAEAPEPIGFCHLERRERVGLVQALGVLAKWEGRGVGAALLARGVATLCEPGVERIELCTEDDNARAQRLYARAGFTFGRDAFTMRKALGP
jgi:mycothiol synthase